MHVLLHSPLLANIGSPFMMFHELISLVRCGIQTAEKTVNVLQPPRALTIYVNRHGGDVSRYIEYPQVLTVATPEVRMVILYMVDQEVIFRGEKRSHAHMVLFGIAHVRVECI